MRAYLDLDGDLLVKEFKEGLELNSFKEEYKFLTPELNKSNFLPIGAVVSVFVAILSYTGWYYSDRSNKIEHVAVQKITENISKKRLKLTITVMLSLKKIFLIICLP